MDKDIYREIGGVGGKREKRLFALVLFPGNLHL